MWAGGAFIAMSRAIGQIAQVATFLFGARILGPADFGIFAMVSAAAVLMSVTAQAGWSGYILSVRHTHQEVRQVLSLSTLFGLALSLAGLTFAASGVLGADRAVVTSLALWFSVWVLIATLAEGQFAVLLYREQVGAAAACQIAAEVTGFVVAVWSLIEGHGVLALAWGRLAAQGVQLVSMFAVSRTLPTVALTMAVTRGAVMFSAHVVGTRLLSNVSQYIGTFAVGGFLGAEAAGLFRLGQRLVGAASELLNEPARVITWLYLRRTVARFDDNDSPQAIQALQRAIERLMPALLIIGAPLFVGLMLLSALLLDALLGEVWRPAAPIVSILAIKALITIPSNITEPLLAIRGKIRFLPILSTIYVVLSVAFILPTAPYGLYPMTLAHLALGFIAFTIMLGVHKAVLGLDWLRIGRACVPLVPVLGSFALVLIILRALTAGRGLSPLLELAVISAPAAAVYLSQLIWLRPDAVISLFGAIRRTG